MRDADELYPEVEVPERRRASTWWQVCLALGIGMFTAFCAGFCAGYDDAADREATRDELEHIEIVECLDRQIELRQLRIEDGVRELQRELFEFERAADALVRLNR